jgi:hypothetical protein
MQCQYRNYHQSSFGQYYYCRVRIQDPILKQKFSKNFCIISCFPPTETLFHTKQSENSVIGWLDLEGSKKDDC